MNAADDNGHAGFVKGNMIATRKKPKRSSCRLTLRAGRLGSDGLGTCSVPPSSGRFQFLRDPH
jgi:hypothetical protein